MSLSECNTALGAATPTLTPTPSSVQSRPHHAPYHHHLRPPDVEEALSSMLWTPYERTSNTPPVSSTEEDEEDEDNEERQEKAADLDEDELRLHRKLRKSQSSYESTLSHLLPPPAHHLPLLPVPFSKSTSDERRRQRNRYSYPASYSPSPSHTSASAYYGSPAHTLTQWCSSAATAIKEPPSYESLYEASVSGVGVARASLARVQPINLQCDRSQRSQAAATTTATQHVDSVENDNDNEGEHNDDNGNDNHNDNDNKVCDGDGQEKLTANVPTERLMRSFTDDYISQVSELSIFYTILIGNGFLWD